MCHYSCGIYLYISELVSKINNIIKMKATCVTIEGGAIPKDKTKCLTCPNN
jgi:hypothetical protein